MNKKEQTEYERVATLAAFTRTAPVPFDVPPPTYDCGQRHTVGWRFNTYSKRVWLAWSESVAHGDGEYPTDPRNRSGSQRSIALFSTEALALRAMRYDVKMECARALREIDKRIEAARSEGIAMTIDPHRHVPNWLSVLAIVVEVSIIWRFA